MSGEAWSPPPDTFSVSPLTSKLRVLIRQSCTELTILWAGNLAWAWLAGTLGGADQFSRRGWLVLWAGLVRAELAGSLGGAGHLAWAGLARSLGGADQFSGRGWVVLWVGLVWAGLAGSLGGAGNLAWAGLAGSLGGGSLSLTAGGISESWAILLLGVSWLLAPAMG